jgi:hypothetical protein
MTITHCAIYKPGQQLPPLRPRVAHNPGRVTAAPEPTRRTSAVEEELLDHSPAAHVRRPRLDYESHATGLDRNELGALPRTQRTGRRAWRS